MGIVGFGLLAQRYYAPALRKLGRQLDICVADPLASSRDAAARAFRHPRSYADHHEMLEREPLAAVLVAAPPSTHLAIWQSIKPFHLPVFMEKPFPMAHEIDALDPADPAWSRLMVNFNRRFWPAYANLARVTRGKVLGRVMSARFVLHVDTRKWSRVTNHRALPQEGGVIHDLGSQVLDLALTAFEGSPIEFNAKSSGASIASERIELGLRWPNGVTVECDLAYGCDSRESVTIEGEKASLHLRNPNFLCWVERRRSWHERALQAVPDLAVLGYRGIVRSQSMMRYSVSQALRSFVEAMESARPFSPGFSDALRVARYTKLAEERLTEKRESASRAS
jgi:predicted dehydrogenase